MSPYILCCYQASINCASKKITILQIITMFPELHNSRFFVIAIFHLTLSTLLRRKCHAVLVSLSVMISYLATDDVLIVYHFTPLSPTT